MVLEKTLESPLDCKEIQPVHSEGDQPWVFFGRNDAEAETQKHKETKIMVSGPITSWQIDGKKVETVAYFLFLGSKITVDSDYSHKILKCLLLGRRAMVNLESILESRDIALPTKVHMVKAMVFPVVMYDCESWTIKKAEHRRTDAFRFWCWRRLFRVFQFSSVAQSYPTLCDS